MRLIGYILIIASWILLLRFMPNGGQGRTHKNEGLTSEHKITPEKIVIAFGSCSDQDRE